MSGQIESYPPGSGGLVVLSSQITGASGPGTTVAQGNFSRDYMATPGSDGLFTFPAVATGKYNLSLMFPSGMLYYWFYTDPYSPYTIVVRPLCPVSAGIYVNGGGF